MWVTCTSWSQPLHRPLGGWFTLRFVIRPPHLFTYGSTSLFLPFSVLRQTEFSSHLLPSTTHYIWRLKRSPRLSISHSSLLSAVYHTVSQPCHKKKMPVTNPVRGGPQGGKNVSTNLKFFGGKVPGKTVLHGSKRHRLVMLDVHEKSWQHADNSRLAKY